MFINGPEKPHNIDGKGGRVIFEEIVTGGPTLTTTVKLPRPGEIRYVATGREHPNCGGEIVLVERAEGRASHPGVYGGVFVGPLPDKRTEGRAGNPGAYGGEFVGPLPAKEYAIGSWPKATGEWVPIQSLCRVCGSKISEFWPLDDQEPVSLPSPPYFVPE